MALRHVVFIEEAHNIIAPDSQQTSSDSVDPKISATAYIVKMLAEVRALREGIVIADQLPTALAIEVTKNTNLKIVHRLTAQDDREQIGQAISASALQLEQVASFSKGKSLIYHEKVQKPFTVQVAEWKKPKIDYDYSNDRELYMHLKGRKQIQDAISCALDSWKYKYFDDFNDNRIMEFFENFKMYIEENVYIKEKEKMLIECNSILKKAQKIKELWFEKEDNEVIHFIINQCNELRDCIETLCVVDE